MHIGILIILGIIIFFIGVAQQENNSFFSKICYTITVIIIIWGSMALTKENKEQKFISKTSVKFQDKIAFITHENNLVNCSEKFKMQFKPGDSVYIFQEQSAYVYGIKFEGGDFIYKTSLK